MKVLGLSPLDKDATVSLVEDGRVLFAAAEERYSRVKQHAGFPHRALADALERTGTAPGDIDLVAYPFLDWEEEARLMDQALDADRARTWERKLARLSGALASADAAVAAAPRSAPIPGLSHPDQRMAKDPLKRLAYRALGLWGWPSARATEAARRRWRDRAVADHRRYADELAAGLAAAGIGAPLERVEHHRSHAANAYHASGFERALIVTLDGYGSGLAGSVSLGHEGRIERLHGLAFPHSLGSFYEMVTSSLGFHPDRHAGKVVGLAAYGDPERLIHVLMARMDTSDGDLHIDQALNVHLSRHLASRYPMIDVAAAWQTALERAACAVVTHWARATGCDRLVLSGGVTANVKLNQRLHALPEVASTFVYPNMGDGGCGTGLALDLSRGDRPPTPIETVYLGPEFSEAEMEAALRAADLPVRRPDDLAGEVAAAIHGGRVVARFAGRMEYGPRALGNRSILYHAREPEVNQWLNQRLGRTEFMPFAPVTLWEHRERCYRGLEGAEHTATFMTITCDCTDWMVEHCPAAVHVDGTARPQLLTAEANPGYHAILSAYERLSGIPCLINTSFNMHEEPIVRSPEDAVRAFLLGHLDLLALGPFLVEHPDRAEAPGRV